MASIDDVVIVRNDEGFDPLAFRDVVKQTREAAAVVAAELTAKQAESPDPEPTPAAAKVKRSARLPRQASERSGRRSPPDLRSFALVRWVEAVLDRFAGWVVRVAAVSAIVLLAWSFRSNVETLIRQLILPDQGITPAEVAVARGTGSLIGELSGATESLAGESALSPGEGVADRSGTEEVWANRGRLGDGEPGGVGEPVEGPSRIDWGDDAQRFIVDASTAAAIDERSAGGAGSTGTGPVNVVSTAPSTPEPTTEPAPAPAPAPAPSDPPASAATSPDPPAGIEAGPIEVLRTDGSIDTVTVPAQSLEFALPTSAERVIMNAYPAEEVSPFVVVDPDGEIGDPNRRYVHTDRRLIDTGVIDGSPAVGNSTSEPSTAAVDLGGGLGEQQIIGRLEALPGVIEVRRVAPGLLQVVTDGSTTTLADVPGIDGVDEDLLLGYASAVPPATTLPHGIAPRPSSLPAPVGDRGSPRHHHSIVAVIDSGFDRAHPELIGRWWSNIDEDCFNGADDDRNGFIDDCAGWDFGRGDADVAPEPEDPWAQHGNAVASVIAAARDGFGITGVAPESTLMPLKVARSNGTVPLSAVAAALRYAVDNGADVVNISLITQTGVDRSDVTVLERAVADAEARGVMVVVGAGNDARNLSLTPAWPASFSTRYANVLTVGADLDDRLPAPFTNLGDAVSVWAPGVSVPVALGNGAIVLSTGSSFAAPAIAGALAEQLSTLGPVDIGEQRRRLFSTATELAGRHHLALSTKRDTPVGSINLADPPAAQPTSDTGYSGWRRNGW